MIRFYKVLILILTQVLGFWMKERRNQCNHNLHSLQSNVSTIFYIDWVYFNRAGTHLYSQSKFTYFHIFISLMNIDINRCHGRVKFPSLPSIQICFYFLSVSWKSRFCFFSSVQFIIYNLSYYHSEHWVINHLPPPPSHSQKNLLFFFNRPLKSSNCPSLPFLGNSLLYIGFS